jgi:hypothetical protein
MSYTQWIETHAYEEFCEQTPGRVKARFEAHAVTTLAYHFDDYAFLWCRGVAAPSLCRIAASVPHWNVRSQARDLIPHPVTAQG